MYFVDPCDQNLRPPVFALLFVIYKINDIFHSHPCVFLCLFEQKTSSVHLACVSLAKSIHVIASNLCSGKSTVNYMYRQTVAHIFTSTV